MPARHTSLQDVSLFGAGCDPKAQVDERGCRRDIRSNGWIVIFKSLLFENRSGRRNRFSSFGADLSSAISPASRPHVKSGPDVFADALVPTAGAWRPGNLNSKTPTFQNPDIDQRVNASRCTLPVASRASPRSHDPGRSAALGIGRLAAMVIVWRNVRVNRIPQTYGNLGETWVCVILQSSAPRKHLRAIHRDT